MKHSKGNRGFGAAVCRAVPASGCGDNCREGKQQKQWKTPVVFLTGKAVRIVRAAFLQSAAERRGLEFDERARLWYNKMKAFRTGRQYLPKRDELAFK